MLLLYIEMKNLLRPSILTVILIVMLAASCSAPGMFLPVDQVEQRVEILSIAQGSVLNPTDSFDVALDYDEEMFLETMVIEFVDRDGAIVFSVEFDQEQILELPLLVELPSELENGTYTAHFKVFQDGEEVGSESSIFFVVRDEYRIEAINAYPQFFYPGGKGLVYANLSLPENADPFLKWLSDDVVLSEGLLSEGTDILQLDVPEREGVYSIRLEVFPFSPAPETAFSFISEISLEAQFFVSSTQDIDESEFSPEEDYYSLFHFRGEAVDWGAAGGKKAIENGSLDLGIVQGLFGYFFDGTGGFIVDEILLPDVQGELQPFSFSARLALFEQTGTFVSMFDRFETPVFSVGFTGEGLLFAELNGARSSVEYLFSEGNPTDLTVSVIPAGEAVTYMWYVDGMLLGVDKIEYEVFEIEDGGVTYLGGENSPVAVVDEVGIYYKVIEGGVEVDAAVYKRAMDRIYGDDLVFAEGFDGIFLPETLEYSDDAEQHSIEASSLLIPPSADVELLLSPGVYEKLIIEVDHFGKGVIALIGATNENSYFEAESDGVGVVEADDEEITAEGTEQADSDGDVLERTDPGLVSPDGVVLMELENQNGSLIVRLNGEEHDLGLVDDDLILSFTSGEAFEQVELRSILVVKNNYRTEEN